MGRSVVTYGTRPLRVNGVWLVALAAAMWGMESVVRLPLLQSLSSIQVVFLEHMLLSLYAMPVLWAYRRELYGLNGKQWFSLLYIAWGGSGLATLLFTSAFVYGNPSVVMLLQKVQPIVVIVMARWLLRERLPKGFAVDLLIALFGLYLLVFGWKSPMAIPGGDGSALWGAWLSIGAAVLWGGSTVFGSYLLRAMRFETLTGARFFFTLPFVGVILWQADPNWPQMFETASAPHHVAPLLVMVLFPGLLSLLLYYRGLAVTKASYATLAELTFPAAGVLINWMFLGTAISLSEAIGFAIIWMVVYRLARRREREK
jgi:drug/metabolite transporter (DMT)-like permease